MRRRDVVTDQTVVTVWSRETTRQERSRSLTRTGLQDAAVSVVEPDATDHAAIGSPTALKLAVDDVGDHAVAGLPSGGDVCGGWPPCSGDDVVGRWLGRLRGHLE